MRGAKGNARARTTQGLRNDRHYKAPFMRPPKAEKHERHRKDGHPLGSEQRDPRGLPYMIATGGAAMPCMVRPTTKKE